MREFLVLILRAPNGSVVVLAVAASAVSPCSVELSLLVARARASAPPQPELPWFLDGDGVVEPREVRGVADLSVAASPAASTAAWSEPLPRRSLRREREARELIALSKLFRDTRRIQRQVRDARRLQRLFALVAAIRRAALVG